MSLASLPGLLAEMHVACEDMYATMNVFDYLNARGRLGLALRGAARVSGELDEVRDEVIGPQLRASLARLRGWRDAMPLLPPQTLQESAVFGEMRDEVSRLGAAIRALPVPTPPATYSLEYVLGLQTAEKAQFTGSFLAAAAAVRVRIRRHRTSQRQRKGTAPKTKVAVLFKEP